MIFLRAIPFSLNILWRLALVFPFLLLGLAVVGGMAAIVILATAFVAPILSLIIIVFFGVAASILPTLIGTRLGLQARRVTLRNSALGLVIPAIGYGFFEAVCALCIVFFGMAIYYFATGLTLQDLNLIAQMEPEFFFVQLLSLNPVIGWSLVLVGGALILSLRAALLMPIAGASIGADPSGQGHTPFYGFGSDFWALFPLVILSYVGSALAVPLVVAICSVLGLGDNLALAMDGLAGVGSSDLISALQVELVVFAGLLFVIQLWAFSLQCAGATLVYLRYIAHENASQEALDTTLKQRLTELSEEPPERQTQRDDVMALVRSRMNKNKN